MRSESGVICSLQQSGFVFSFVRREACVRRQHETRIAFNVKCTMRKRSIRSLVCTTAGKYLLFFFNFALYFSEYRRARKISRDRCADEGRPRRACSPRKTRVSLVFTGNNASLVRKRTVNHDLFYFAPTLTRS